MTKHFPPKCVRQAISAIVAAVALSVVPIGALLSAAAATPDYSEKTIPASEVGTKIRFFGRTQPAGSGVALDWSYSGFEFNADCEGTVAASLTAMKGWGTKGIIQVVVDGKCDPAMKVRFEVVDQPPYSNTALYTLASNLKKGPHKIQVYKVSEAQYARLALESIRINGVLLEPPVAPKLKLEFYGDSITCGEGVENIPSDPVLGQDAYRTYAAITARNLGADAHLISASSWTLLEKANPRMAIPKIFEKTCAFRNGTPWDFSKYKPNVVVINLGTNDEHTRDKKWSGDDFIDGVKSFTAALREKYPDATIIWAYGMMTKDGSLQSAAVDQIRQKDQNVFYLQLPQRGGGFNGHPDVQSQEQSAGLLTEFVKKTMKL